MSDRGPLHAVWTVNQWHRAADDLLLEFKRSGDPRLAHHFSTLLAPLLMRLQPDLDCVLAMPCYMGPGARRSFNPIEMILRDVDPRKVGTPMLLESDNPVRKTSETRKLADLSQKERMLAAVRELRPSLRVTNPGAIEGLVVGVVDDVITHGCTMREVALALRAAGASRVHGIALFWRDPKSIRPEPSNAPLQPSPRSRLPTASTTSFAAKLRGSCLSENMWQVIET